MLFLFLLVLRQTALLRLTISRQLLSLVLFFGVSNSVVESFVHILVVSEVGAGRGGMEPDVFVQVFLFENKLPQIGHCTCLTSVESRSLAVRVDWAAPRSSRAH